MDHQLEQLQDWTSESQHIVFFGDTEVSTKSGTPDLHSMDSLYHQQYAFPLKTILSHSFFERNPKGFYRFYRSKMLFPQTRLNAAHWRLVGLETTEKLTTVVTQNIDGLRQVTGDKAVYELHGSVHRSHCMKCRRFHDLGLLSETGGVPRCPVCGGVVRPDVVLYGECLDEIIMMGAMEAITGVDMLIIGSTSLVVYPAAGLIRYYRRNRLTLVNKSATPYGREAGLVIDASLGEVLGAIWV